MIAVVGSRTFTSYKLLRDTLVPIIGNDEVTLISGGARGADQLAQRFANEYGLAITIYYPDWVKYKRSAGMLRNEKIVNVATEMVAFRVSNSKGTTHCIGLAERKGIPVTVVDLGE